MLKCTVQWYLGCSQSCTTISSSWCQAFLIIPLKHPIPIKESPPTSPSPQSLIVVQLLSCCVLLFVTLWTAACQTPLSFTVSWSLLRLKSIELVRPSNHLILCHPLLLLPSIFPSIRVFSHESALCIRWPNPDNKFSFFVCWKQLRLVVASDQIFLPRPSWTSQLSSQCFHFFTYKVRKFAQIPLDLWFASPWNLTPRWS